MRTGEKYYFTEITSNRGHHQNHNSECASDTLHLFFRTNWFSIIGYWTSVFVTNKCICYYCVTTVVYLIYYLSPQRLLHQGLLLVF
jgi:hypothetical protein